MRKVEYYITENEVDFAENYFYEFQNSLLYQKNNKFYFYSQINNSKEEISVNVKIVKFSIDLVDKLQQILRFSWIKASEISDEPVEGIFDDSIFSVINSTVFKFSYVECKSIFYFVAELFYRYLIGHHLGNGNKRLSLMFLINTLWFFGYYFKWTRGKDKINYGEYKSKIEEWVEMFKNRNNLEKDIIQNILMIEKWIKDNIVIALNWRW